jgi:hypothetical protein
MAAGTSEQAHSGDAIIGIVRSDKVRTPRVFGSTGRGLTHRKINRRCTVPRSIKLRPDKKIELIVGPMDQQ